MNSLVLVTIGIIVYAEVFPTISVFFELLRTKMAYWITIIQTQTVGIQEKIEEAQERMKDSQVQAVGFHVHDEYEEDGEDE